MGGGESDGRIAAREQSVKGLAQQGREGARPAGRPSCLRTLCLRGPLGLGSVVDGMFELQRGVPGFVVLPANSASKF